MAEKIYTERDHNVWWFILLLTISDFMLGFNINWDELEPPGIFIPFIICGGIVAYYLLSYASGTGTYKIIGKKYKCLEVKETESKNEYIWEEVKECESNGQKTKR